MGKENMNILLKNLHCENIHELNLKWDTLGCHKYGFIDDGVILGLKRRLKLKGYNFENDYIKSKVDSSIYHSKTDFHSINGDNSFHCQCSKEGLVNLNFVVNDEKLKQTGKLSIKIIGSECVKKIMVDCFNLDIDDIKISNNKLCECGELFGFTSKYDKCKKCRPKDDKIVILCPVQNCDWGKDVSGNKSKRCKSHRNYNQCQGCEIYFDNRKSEFCPDCTIKNKIKEGYVMCTRCQLYIDKKEVCYQCIEKQDNHTYNKTEDDYRECVSCGKLCINNLNPDYVKQCKPCYRKKPLSKKYTKSDKDGPKVYFEVGFKDKDKAKDLGLWWDNDKKSWFLPEHKSNPKNIQEILKIFEKKSVRMCCKCKIKPAEDGLRKCISCF